MSKTRSEKYNTTGFYRVSIQNSPSYKKGFRWRYRYHDNNNKQKSISSTDLKKLEEKVQRQNLPWKVIDDELAQKSLIIDKGMIEK